MKGRLDRDRTIVSTWKLPDIDGKAVESRATLFCETELAERRTNQDEAIAGPPPRNLAPQAGVSDPQSGDAANLAERAEAIERGMREGLERGYAEGFAAGRRAAESQLVEQVRRLESIVQRLGDPMRSLERPVEEAVIALALEIARWVIGDEIARSRDFLLKLIRDAVAKVPIDVGDPVVVLNPADVDVIRTLAPELESNGITLVAEDSIEPGGCRVIANEADQRDLKDRRWHPRAMQSVCEVDLTLASRWRDAMFALFDGEDT